MKRLCFLLACFVLILHANVNAQMSSAMINSSERTINGISLTDINSVKVEATDDDKIITLCRSQTLNQSVFMLTTDGNNNVECVIFPQDFYIYDFKIYKDFVYFCGTYLGVGFISKMHIQDISIGTYFQYWLFPQTTVVYDLEVVLSSQVLVVTALGYNENTSLYSVIYYDENNPFTYQYSQTTYILQDIVYDDKYFYVVFSSEVMPYDKFGVQRFDNVNPQINYGYTFLFPNNGYETKSSTRRPEKREPTYFIETIGYMGKVLVATVLEHNYPVIASYPHHAIYMFDVDMDNQFIAKIQMLPNEGKPYLKDMVYNPWDNKLRLISHGMYENTFTTLPYANAMYADAIYAVDMSYTIPYADVIIPTNSFDVEGTLNSIDVYRIDNYIVAGKSQTNGDIYWFDKKISVPNTSNGCYIWGYSNVYMYNSILPLNQVYYGFTTGPVLISNASLSHDVVNYNIQCLD